MGRDGNYQLFCILCTPLMMSPPPHTHCTEKSSFWGERRDYWHYLSEGVGELKALDSIVKIVQAQQQVREGWGLIHVTLENLR